jgi:hypothetical protein
MLSAVYCKVGDLCNWIYVLNFDTIAMITIFCTVVLSVIQGVAHNTGVLPFSKGRALQRFSPRCVTQDPLHPDAFFGAKL